MILTRLTAAAVMLVCAGSAHAQSQQEFVEALAGSWFIFDATHGGPAGPCQILLDTQGEDGSLGATSTNCRGPLADLQFWDIDGEALALRDGTGSDFARLGGNQTRVTGELLADGVGVILERSTGDPFTRSLAQAVQLHDCVYRGTTSTCASDAELAAPPLDGPEGSGEIRVLANLNVRTQPRRDAATIGVVAAQACVVVNQCVSASDGIWCRARFGETDGWLPQTALRQDEWPVVTYVAGCGEAGNFVAEP